ncbi:hypothetical protein [Desmospora activa]|uniref:YqzE-like protein n=1 Tax=Desmospora activa DSM 45169 TaxID=1121389 RepID=A0A2T4Z1P5_9BACL|nr:hypothetical protein [Desmospora activa]PTM54694.1 hypothetical protein C8J48_3346 [Desmospora activa DSM 45169]
MRDLLSWLFSHFWQAFLVFGPVFLTFWLQRRRESKKSDTRGSGNRTSTDT